MSSERHLEVGFGADEVRARASVREQFHPRPRRKRGLRRIGASIRMGAFLTAALPGLLHITIHEIFFSNVDTAFTSDTVGVEGKLVIFAPAVSSALKRWNLFKMKLAGRGNWDPTRTPCQSSNRDIMYADSGFYLRIVLLTCQA